MNARVQARMEVLRKGPKRRLSDRWKPVEIPEQSDVEPEELPAEPDETKRTFMPRGTTGMRSPLIYMLSVMNDENIAVSLRLKAATMAAPYIHVKPGETAAAEYVGVKAQRDLEALRIGVGVLETPAPPKNMRN